MNIRKLAVAFVVTMALASVLSIPALALYGEILFQSNEPIEVYEDQSLFKFTDLRLVDMGQDIAVRGSVKNTGQVGYLRVTFDITLYDEVMGVIDSSTFSVSGLGAGRSVEITGEPLGIDPAQISDVLVTVFDATADQALTVAVPAKSAKPQSEGVTGFLGVPWGASTKQVSDAMAKRPSTKLKESESDGLLYEGPFSGEDATLIFYFLDGKLYQGIAVVKPKEAAVISKWRGFIRDLTDKYGDPTSQFHYFQSPYSEGDGYETQAIELGKGHLSAKWDFETSNIICGISDELEILIGYADTRMSALADARKHASQSKDL